MHFRIEIDPDDVAHLIFDMAESSVNVLSQSVIAEIGAVAGWFEGADVRGMVIRSAKPVFCAGGDLAELGAAYDAITTLAPAERSAAARAFFAPMNHHLRRLEAGGKPVAVAIGGLALGGGCEFALAAHYRVLADSPHAALGLPEVVIGLMPGAGGTQRLPRLIGVEQALPVLMDGAKLASRAALEAGIVDALVAPGEEVAAAQRWVVASTDAAQPWDRPGWSMPGAADWRASVAKARAAMLAATGGNYPAPVALFECLEQGLGAAMEDGIALEIAAFSELIQRPEPRNMIHALFVGAQDYAKRKKAQQLPEEIATIGEAILVGLSVAAGVLRAGGTSPDDIDAVLERLGFAMRTADLPVTNGHGPVAPDAALSGNDYWFEAADAGELGRIARILMNGSASGCVPFVSRLVGGDRAAADNAAVRLHGYPAWSGGPLCWLDRLQESRTPFEQETAS